MERDKLKVFERVFDYLTLNTLIALRQAKRIDTIEGAIKTGKEADVYLGTLNDKPVALKIFRIKTSNFNTMHRYIKGDPRFENLKHNKKDIVFAWAKKEFKNLRKAERSGVRVPKPLVQKNNVLVMEFIGRNGKASPNAKEKPPKNPEKWWEIIKKDIIKMAENKLVHGDLSEYNLLNHYERLVIIDMAQSVVKEHHLSEELLKRDVNTITKWFKTLGVETNPDDLIEEALKCLRK